MRLFNKPDKTITISTETIIKVILLTVLAYIVLQMLASVTHQLKLIIISAFLALALNPAVVAITRRLKSGSRVRATGAAYVLVLSILVSFMTLTVPPLVQQTSEFIKDVPKTINNFQSQDSALSRTVRRFELDKQLDDFSNDFERRISSNVTAPVFSAANRVIGTLVSVVTVLVLTFMMLVEGPLWLNRIMELQPEAVRSRRKKTARRMYKVVTGYVNGQVLIAAIGAGFAMVALLIASTIFDVSVNAIALAAIIFVFGLIPLIGNTLGAIVVVIFSLLSSVPLALTMAVYFLLYQQIENATLQPYIQSRSNQLTPLIVFVAALVGAGMAGLLGALAAIPVAGCIRILLEDRFPDMFPTLHTVDDTSKK